MAVTKLGGGVLGVGAGAILVLAGVLGYRTLTPESDPAAPEPAPVVSATPETAAAQETAAVQEPAAVPEPAPAVQASEQAAAAEVADPPANPPAPGAAPEEVAASPSTETAVPDKAVESIAAAPEVAAPVPELAPEVTVAQPEAEPAPAADAPKFDTVRVETDGSALVAGLAPPDSTLRILLDGVEVATGQVDRAGNFASLLTLAPSDSPRLMALEATLPDGTKVVSGETVAIAPVKAPIAVAAAPEAVASGETVEFPPEPATKAPAPAALLLTDDGATLLSAPQMLGADAAVTIDTITYTPDGAVQLSGQAASGAFLRFYIDTAEVLAAQVPPEGPWTAILPDLAPGIYTLRVDQIGSLGEVTSRFETPFKRETPEALAQATGQPAVAAEPAPAGEQLAAAPEASAEAAGAEPEVLADVVADAASTAPDDATGVAEADQPAPAAQPVLVADAASSPPVPVSVTVQPGFTLWAIARENFGNGVMYVQVFEANRDKIVDPDLIYPGQVFTIPQPAP